MGRSISIIKDALSELEQFGIIRRKRESKSSRIIFILILEDSIKGRNAIGVGRDNCSYTGHKSVLAEANISATNIRKENVASI
ncbi:hypothetical protein lbkm_0248 [Lachnospiraceae bacterium KM106-2]|nr:hypothetical protein lbkm_0248 [Lachnospiraceae bacterium KM106-2]